MSRYAILIALCLTCAAPSLRAQEDFWNSSLPDQMNEEVAKPDEVLGEELSREEVEKLIAKAHVNRLRSERELVAREIEENSLLLLYPPQDVDRALKLLRDDPANTQADNIQRICKAYAAVEPAFARLYGHYSEEQYEKAVEAGQEIAAGETSSFQTAAASYVYALSLEQAEQFDAAQEAYELILREMPDRISFASEAAQASAALWEKMGRGSRAMQMYNWTLTNYGLTLSGAQWDRMLTRAKELADIYDDPLGSVADLMRDVKERLATVDSGDQTREKQERIVAILDDLIAAAEEQESGGGGSAGSGKRQKRQGGQSQGRAPGQGQSAGQASGGSPASDSALRPGQVDEPGELSKIHDSDEAGDWARLSPRQRERLEQIGRKAIPERYRDAVSDYSRAVAGQED